MKKNEFKEAYKKAVDERAAARAAAVKMVLDTEHFVVKDEEGYPDWEKCFFGATQERFILAHAAWLKMNELYWKREYELKEEAKLERAKKKVNR